MSKINKKEKPEIQSVVQGKVKARNKTLGNKIRSLFLARDVDELKSYIVEDIVYPGMVKAAHGAVDMVFNRDVRTYNSDRRGNTVIRYDKASQNSHRNYEDRSYIKKRDFRDLTFETRGDAEEVLSNLVDLIKEYDKASIADLYDLCEITSTFTDNKYGWTDLSSASVRRVSDGYILDLPRAEQFNS